MKTGVKNILLLSMLFLMTACGTYKRQAYLQDMEPDLVYSMPLQPDATIAKGDKLSIYVSSSNPSLVAPFNRTGAGGAINPSSMGTSMVSSTLSSGSGISGASAQEAEGYEVDNDGNIVFPVLGKIHVEGMTIKDVKSHIETAITARRYVTDPTVSVRFTNFRFIILGEGGSGVYHVPDGRMNIFEALAMSGDLTDDAVKNEVQVIRTVDGNRRMYTIDLKTKDCYYSPAFFIHQNDMIYVKPKDTKFDNDINNRNTVLATLLSILSTAINSVIWFSYLFK